MTTLGSVLDFGTYYTAAAIFPRLLGVIYFFVFGAFLFQVRGLLGENGILPIENFLRFVHSRIGGAKRFYYVPSIFWWKASDAILFVTMVLGTILSILLMLDVAPPLMLALLYILHLSVLAIGQDFLSFGWETFMLEITFNTFFLSLSPTPNVFVLISLNLLLFRFHFQAGISKILSRDATWRDLTAIAYHYQTQPLPNTVAWYVHKLPMWFHKFSTALMFFIELIVPFALLGTQQMRLFAFFALAGLQFVIWLTGNFSYLNHMTVVLCLILVSDKYLDLIFPAVPAPMPSPMLLDIVISVAGGVLILIQLISLWHYFRPNKTCSRVLSWVQECHIGNHYGIFAVMTTKRYEIVIEGSDDGVEWQEYLFRFKPSELSRRPRRISPYQPRLDWQAWFLPFSSYETQWWFQNFLMRLLQGSPEVLKLLRYNPFPEKPPQYIRALAYDYEFTTFKEKKETGNWWKRTLVGPYSPRLTLIKR